MPFTLEQFAIKRPYLFHLTARDNLEVLLHQPVLLPASHLFKEANVSAKSREKRRNHLDVIVGGRKIQIRDQAPLHEGNMALSEGWSFADFVAHLNGRVFFWPGRKDGRPIDYGKRHYERYASEAPIILRLPTAGLFAVNSGLDPEFCRYNSGSPRWTYGKASPRGDGTFVKCNAADFGIGNVVEVTYPEVVRLPEKFEIGDCPGGPWRTANG